MDDLFGTQKHQAIAAIALARAIDPQTSKDAAEKMVKSGELNRQEKWVYGAILGYVQCHTKEDFTTKDTARYWWPETYYKAYDICRRRFSGLRNKGKIEWTGEKRGGCCVWRLV